MARRSARHIGRLELPSGLLTVARIVAASLVYLVVLALSSVAAYAFGQKLVLDSLRGTFGLVGLGLAEAAALAVVLVLWRWVDRRPIGELGLATHGAQRRWLRGAVVGVAMMSFVVFVGYTLIDGAAWGVNPDPVRAGLALVAGLLGFLVQGPAEEVLFRGYVLENLRDEWGVRWAAVVSSLLFGLFHAANPGFGPLPFVNLVLFGAATAVYKLNVDRGQLWGVFAIHTIWNWLQQVVFGLPNSGLSSVPENALFNVTPNTSVPDALWGGGFGPEGTLATSVVLLALLGFALRRGRAAQFATS